MAGDLASFLEIGGGASGASGTSSPSRAAPKSAQEPPLRYACHVCGVCIATSDGLVEARERDDVLVFARLYPADGNVDRGAARTVCCPGCQEALGTRGDGVFLLRRDRVARKPQRLEVLVYGLKREEIADLAPVLVEAFPHSNVTQRVLLKAELRGFQITGGGPRAPPEFVVVVHRHEGRALLTDRNGFYHDVLGSAWQHTRGNVLVVLTRVEPKADGDLFDQQLVRNLSVQGDQPTIGAISAQGRVLTWETTPSVSQLKQLQLLAAKAYFREPSAAPPGIPQQWLRQPPKASPTSWCSLL